LKQDFQRRRDIDRDIELRCALGSDRSCRSATPFVRPELNCVAQRSAIAGTIDNRAVTVVLDDFDEAIVARCDDRQSRRKGFQTSV